MSYLLEALRKSDRERRQNAEPILASVYGGRRFDSRRWRRRRLLVTLALATLLTAVAAWQLSERIVISPRHPVTVAPAPPPAAKPEAAAVADAPTPPPAPVMPPPQTLPLLGDLPATERARLPKLVFSLHSWSETSAKRSLVVNGRIVHEGDQITATLKLAKITPDGAVFRFDDGWFRVNVLENW